MSGEINLQKPTNLSYSRDIIHCHPYLQERWPKVVYLFRDATGNDLSITCTWRSAEEQQRLYMIGRGLPGRIVTMVDGITKMSDHNIYPSRALDVVVNITVGNIKPAITWDAKEYSPLIEVCRKVGLVSGGSWERFKDFPHICLPPGVL